jgi:hypothetical protein
LVTQRNAARDCADLDDLVAIHRNESS